MEKKKVKVIVADGEQWDEVEFTEDKIEQLFEFIDVLLGEGEE